MDMRITDAEAREALRIGNPRPVPHPRAYVADCKGIGCVTPRKVVIEENKQTS
jgi:hypothetical protein